MKTINFELSKKLNELGLLDNIETEYIYDINGRIRRYDYRGDCLFFIKTLTLEEAIEFLNNNKITFLIENSPYYSGNEKISISVEYIKGKLLDFGSEKGKTLLEAIEKMITFLINDKILNPKK